MEKIAMLSRAPFASSTTAVGLLRPLEVHAATAGPDRAKRQLMFGNGNLCSSPEPQLVHEAPQICALVLPQLSTTSALTCRHEGHECQQGTRSNSSPGESHHCQADASEAAS